MRDWPETLVKLGIIYATNDNRSYLEKKKEYRAKLKKLYDALNARLFGDPKQIGNPESKNTASGELIAWLDSLISEISGSRYDLTRPCARSVSS